MDCKTCDELLTGYRREVALFKNAVRDFGDDSRPATQEMQHLSQKCKDASDALMTHWCKDHANLTPKALA